MKGNGVFEYSLRGAFSFVTGFGTGLQNRGFQKHDYNNTWYRSEKGKGVFHVTDMEAPSLFPETERRQTYEDNDNGSRLFRM